MRHGLNDLAQMMTAATAQGLRNFAGRTFAEFEGNAVDGNILRLVESG